MKNNLLFFALFSVLFLTSCASISPDEARNSALTFVEKNVQFGINENNSTKPVSTTMNVVNERKEGDDFVFEILVMSNAQERVKSAKVNVVVDSNGKVISFNGQPVFNP